MKIGIENFLREGEIEMRRLGSKLGRGELGFDDEIQNGKFGK